MKPVADQAQADIERLERQYQQTLQEIERLRAELRDLAEPTADEADTVAYEREKIWALIQSMQRKRESLERSIRMAHNGTYGLCESCGQRIDPARLEILPETTLCFACQRRVELETRRAYR
jgi:DnaK suppressor protein